MNSSEDETGSTSEHTDVQIIYDLLTVNITALTSAGWIKKLSGLQAGTSGPQFAQWIPNTEH